jgi:hypothetical protein
MELILELGGDWMLWLCLWSVCLCSSIECEDVKAWMDWMEVVGGIYSLQPLPSRWLSLLSMGTPDSPVMHMTLYCSLYGACHVSRSLGFGAVDRWSPLSSCGTGQTGGTPDSPVHSDFCTIYCSVVSAVDRWVQLTVAPLAHRTVRCTIDSPMNYSGLASKETRERSVREVPQPGHRTVSGAPLGAPMHVFAPNFV